MAGAARAIQMMALDIYEMPTVHTVFFVIVAVASAWRGGWPGCVTGMFQAVILETWLWIEIHETKGWLTIVSGSVLFLCALGEMARGVV